MSEGPPHERDILICRVDAVRIGIEANQVDRVARAVRLTPLADAPPGVEGIIQVGARILPVLNLRERFGLPPRAVTVSDKMVIARLPQGGLALRVDDVEGLTRESPDCRVDWAAALFGGPAVDAIPAGFGGIILIQAPDRMLSEEDRRRLPGVLPEAP